VLAAVVAAGIVVVLIRGGQHRVAVLIGAAEPGSVAGWQAGDAAIGPLQTQRVFYPGPLPRAYTGSYCEQLERVNGDGLTCIVSYKDADLATNNVVSYVRSIPADVNAWLVFHHEPEDDTFPGGGGREFVMDFERNVAAIRSAAGCTDCHIKVAMAANAYQYHSAGRYSLGTGCSFIPPAQYVDAYFVDVYEPKPTGAPLERGPASIEWDDWLHCVTAADEAASGHRKPLGIAEYGLGTAAPDAIRARTIRADDTYLRSFRHLALWEYWDVGPEWAVTGHPLAAAAWRSVAGGH
jgi:hypothetical protein